MDERTRIIAELAARLYPHVSPGSGETRTGIAVSEAVLILDYAAERAGQRVARTGSCVCCRLPVPDTVLICGECESERAATGAPVRAAYAAQGQAPEPREGNGSKPAPEPASGPDTASQGYLVNPHETEGALLPEHTPDRLHGGCPQVGCAATSGAGSDAYPFTVVRVSPSGHRIEIRRDEPQVVSGSFMEGNATCVYRTARLDAPTEVATRRRDGRYVLRGHTARQGGTVHLGSRRYYQDPHF